MKKFIEYISEYSQTITFIGGILALLGAYLSTVKSDIDSKAHEKTINDIRNRIIGGNSYCIVDLFIFSNDKDSKPNFSMFLNGDIPLKNVVIKIEDYARRQMEIRRLGIDDPTSLKIQQIINDNAYTFQYAAVYPTSKFTDIKLPTHPDQKDLIYFITIDSDTGQTNEIIKVTDYKTINRKYDIEIKRADSVILKTDMPVFQSLLLSEQPHS